MAYRTHYQVCEHFAKRNPKDVRSNNIFTGDNNQVIYSYGTHFMMAVANDDTKTIVLNGDRYSPTTSHHQSHLRSAVQKSMPNDYTSVIIPFSTARATAGNYDLTTVEIIDTQPDREIAYCNTCNWHAFADNFGTAFSNLEGHKRRLGYTCQTTYSHLLGGSVFKANAWTGGVKYFISGIDETRNSRSDGYFLSELPRKVKSYEDALTALQPKIVRDAIAAGLDVKRQGDCFAIPAPDIETRKLKNKVKTKRVPVTRFNYMTGTANPAGTKFEYPMLNNSHGASEIGYTSPKVMYARGVMVHTPPRRDSEHKRLSLGNIWHRIVFNTARGSWGAEGNVD